MKNKLWIFIFAFLVICPGKSLGDEKRSEAVAVTQQDKERVVTGEVFDDQGPIIGATVRVKGTQNGKITDLDGKFTLSVPIGATIVVSFVGYEDKEIVYKGESKLKISMAESATLW